MGDRPSNRGAVGTPGTWRRTGVAAGATFGTLLGCELGWALLFPGVPPWTARLLTITLATASAGLATVVESRRRLAFPVAVHDQSRREIEAHVAERMRAEEALRSSEARAAAFLETAAEAIIVADHGGTIILANQRAETMFGYPRDQLLGASIETLVPARLRGAHVRHRDTFVSAPRARPMGHGLELHGCRRDGSEFPIEVSLSFVRTHDSLLAMSFVSDISQRRDAEKALVMARRAAAQRERLADIGALTAKIVHDLGNPIAGLSMSVQRITRQLARGAEPLESVRGSVEHLTSAVHRLDALTHEFKTFLREQRLVPVAIDLRELLADLRAVWHPEADRRGVRVEIRPPDGGDATLVADPDQLRRLFDNLVKNALEAIDQGPGCVTIAATVGADDIVRISVSDTGPGLPPDANPFALFESTKEDGTGLGLAIAKQIAEAHGGGIEIAPVDPHGAVFQVALPRQGPLVQRDRDSGH
jgi:PAS domain S-box-containing protein